MSTVADITTGGGAIDPMKPVNGATDSSLDFDDPAQVQESAAKAATTPRGRKANNGKKPAAEKSGKSAAPKESRTEEEARPQNNGRRRPQRHVPSPRRRAEAAGRRVQDEIADPDGGESADDAYQRVADRMEGRRGDRGDDRRSERRPEARRERSSDRDEARREREERNNDRQRRRSNREPVGGFDRLREREEGSRASFRDDDGEDRRSNRRPIHDEDEFDDRRPARRGEEDFDYEDDLEDDRAPAARRSRRDEEDRFEEDDRRPARRESDRRRDEREDDLDDDEGGISNSLLREAIDDYDLDEDEILDEFEDDATLERHLMKLDRKAAKAGRLPPPSDEYDEAGENETPTKKPGQAQGRSADGAPAGKQGKGQTPAAKAPPVEGERRIPRFEPDEESKAAYEAFTPETKTYLSKLTGNYDEHLERLAAEKEELQGKVDWMMKRHQEQAFQRFSESMDSFFDEIAQDYGDIFGEGPLEDLDPDGDEAKNRLDFQKELSALARGHKKSGLSDKELKAFQRKTLRLFQPTFEKLESNLRRKTVKKFEKRRRMSVSRPSNRNRQRELTGEDAAASRLDRAYAEAGYAIDPVGDFDGEV